MNEVITGLDSAACGYRVLTLLVRPELVVGSWRLVQTGRDEARPFAIG